MLLRYPVKISLVGLVALATALAVACAGAATPPDPTQSVTSEATPASDPTGAGPTPVPTVAATVTPIPSGIVSAQDSVTLVVGEEPVQLNSFRSVGAALNTPIVKDNLVETLTWQSGDDQWIVPTGATTGWEQLAPDKWRFNLRQGVKFHNGEAWNAEAALPSLEYVGVGANDNSSFPYTGGFSAEAVDEYTLDITCDQPCPIFPNTSIFVTFEAPEYLSTTPDPDWARQSIGFGPYQLVD
jgi:peptide/nickel transport system substrate-binding protein